jgi:hypothetical protein
MMNIDNFINYQIAQIFYDNTDWSGNNIKYWRPQTPEGRWRWILYDTDFGFGLWDLNKVNNNTLEFATEPNGPDWPNPPWSTYMLRRLLENEQFTIKFINNFADLLNTVLSGQNTLSYIDSLKSIIINDITRHLERWGGAYEQWEPQITDLKVFGARRPDNVRTHIQNKFSLSGRATLTINNSHPDAGHVLLNTIEIRSDNWQGIYFKDVPIPLHAIPQTGYRFAGWSGDITDQSDSIDITLSSDLELTASFIQDTSVVINEINYNSSTGFPAGDWIEFYNSANHTIDMSGWKFKDSDDAHIFQFPAQSFLEPDSFFVICRDSALFSLLFPNVNNLIGYFEFGLSNGGELLRLFDDNGRIVDSLTYSDLTPWPVDADGSGATLMLKDALLDNSIPENWVASEAHGTPGNPNQGLSSTDDYATLLPHEFHLGQNYPNPFNPVTHIPITIAKKQKVQLVVYDIAGRIVGTLVDGYLDPGRHVISWTPGNDISSGIYFYRLELKNRRNITKKLIYLR